MTRFVLLRARAHRLLLAAALLTVLLATCVLAALASFTGSVGDAGLRRALQGQSVARTLIEVKTDVSGDEGPKLDAQVRRTAKQAYAGLPVTVESSTRSGPYGLPLALRPAAEPGSNPDLTLLATFAGSRVRMVAGSRPGRPSAEGAVPVALPESAARALRVRPGDRITLADRLGGRPLPVVVTGTYQPVDPQALYWHLDPLGGHGVNTLGFTTYGPMLTDPSVFASGRVAVAGMSWQARADFSAMTTDRIGAVRDDARRALSRLGVDGAQVGSELPELLTGMDRSLLVSRSTLLIGAVQLAVLAGLSLLLVARLLVEERAQETALLRARGASRWGLVALASSESLLLAVPAGVAAPLLAGPLVRLLAGHGALARADLRFSGPLDGATVGTAAATALACALAIAVPAVRRSGSYLGEREARVRRRALPAAVRSGGDVALLALAGLAYWQLSRRSAGSGVLTADQGGTLGVDPVLVVAPALCLLAGTVLAIRLLPLVARLGERRAARGRGLGPAMAWWRLSRSSGPGAGLVLLLALTVAMGIFAIGQGVSWDGSQRDQADFATGADIRVTGTSTTPFGQSGVYDAVPGISAVAPTARSQTTLPRNRLATVLAMDTAHAPDVLRLRGDLADTSTRRLLAPLHRGTAEHAGITLPDGTRQLRLTARLSPAAASQGESPPPDADITVTIEDRYGVPYVVVAGRLPADGAAHPLDADLALAANAEGSPAGPLRLTGLTAAYYLPDRTVGQQLTVSALDSVAAAGKTRPVPVPEGSSWTSKAVISKSGFRASRKLGYALARSGKPVVGGGQPFTVHYDTGEEPFDPYHQDRATITLRPATATAPALAGVATDTFLTSTGTKVGGTADVDVFGADLTVRVTGSVHALPTTPSDGSAADGGGLLLDLPAVNRVLEERQAPGLQPSEWWLATRPGSTGKVAAALRARSDNTSLLVRGKQADELRADPLGAGPRASLPATAIAAAVMAMAGFAVATAGALRTRAHEFAVLRALGTPRRRLTWMIATEQGLLVLVAVAVGIALGALLTHLVVPLIVLTAQAAHPVPGIVVRLPAGPVLELLAAVLVVPLVVVVATAAYRGGPTRTLRRGDE